MLSDDRVLAPRTRGLLVLVGSAVCVALNVGSMRALGQYYPFLFPFAGAMTGVGLVLVVSGASVERIGDRTRPALGRGLLAAMLLGALVGLGANTLVR